MVTGQRQVGKSTMLYHLKEVDLLIFSGSQCYPIEIKKSKLAKHGDKHFKVLEKLNLDLATGLLLCMSHDLLPYNRDVYLCPAYIL